MFTVSFPTWVQKTNISLPLHIALLQCQTLGWQPVLELSIRLCAMNGCMLRLNVKKSPDLYVYLGAQKRQFTHLWCHHTESQRKCHLPCTCRLPIIRDRNKKQDFREARASPKEYAFNPHSACFRWAILASFCELRETSWEPAMRFCSESQR